EWHKVVVWVDGLVGVIEKYVKKGALLHIEAQLETRKYEKDGRDVYTTEVVLRPFNSALNILDGGKNSGSSSRSDEPPAQHQAAQQQQSFNDMDDEIPF
ncbi:MAG: single-stranded DNA-binding protein, partial [Desulfurellales bacterium]